MNVSLAPEQAQRHTPESLKEQYLNFKEAKAQLGLKARGWQALADKLNAPSSGELKARLTSLEERIEKLEEENRQLKSAIAVGDGFDEVGFWLLDRNFDRSKFGDFNLAEDAIERKTVASAEYKRLASLYHPDKGGTEEQMANVRKLYDQMIGMVSINGGLKL